MQQASCPSAHRHRSISMIAENIYFTLDPVGGPPMKGEREIGVQHGMYGNLRFRDDFYDSWKRASVINLSISLI